MKRGTLRLPKSTSILGTKFTVEQGGTEADGDEDCHGETVRLGRKIHVYDKAAEFGDINVLSTFVHESVHAALEVSGISGDQMTGALEEAIATVMENHIMQNLPLWATLLKKVKK